MKTQRITWSEADVRCPFYIADNRTEKSITCEGCGQGTKQITLFPTLVQRDHHMGQYCVRGFESCPLYRCTYACKYADA